MEKEAPVYYLIKEVSNMTGVNPHTIRHWEKSFPNQLKPRRSGDKTQQRLYSQEDIEIVKKIKQLVQDEKFSIPHARNLLESKDSQSVVLLSSKPIPKALTNLLEEVDKFKTEYKSDFESVYDALTHIIEQLSIKPDKTDSDKTYQQIEKLEDLIKGNLDNLQSLKSEREKLLHIVEELKTKGQKDADEKLKLLAELEKTLERKNLFYRISWIVATGTLLLAAASYWIYHILK